MHAALRVFLLGCVVSACSKGDAGAPVTDPSPLQHGTIIPPFPAGYQFASTRQVGGSASTYEVVWVSVPRGGGELWLVQRVAAADSAGGPQWRYLARTPTPKYGSVSFDGCRDTQGLPGPLLVGTELDPVTAQPGVVRAAWRMDTLAGAFVAIDSSRVRCDDPEPSA